MSRRGPKVLKANNEKNAKKEEGKTACEEESDREAENGNSCLSVDGNFELPLKPPIKKRRFI